MTSQAGKQPRIPPLRAVIMDGDALRLLCLPPHFPHGRYRTCGDFGRQRMVSFWLSFPISPELLPTGENDAP